MKYPYTKTLVENFSEYYRLISAYQWPRYIPHTLQITTSVILFDMTVKSRNLLNIKYNLKTRCFCFCDICYPCLYHSLSSDFVLTFIAVYFSCLFLMFSKRWDLPDIINHHFSIFLSPAHSMVIFPLIRLCNNYKN